MRHRFDDTGSPTNAFSVVEQNAAAHGLVEEFMLMANRLVATELLNSPHERFRGLTGKRWAPGRVRLVVDAVRHL